MKTIIRKNYNNVGTRTFEQKACTLEQYITAGKARPGTYIVIATVKQDKNGKEYCCNAEHIWIGNCTPYHEPSTSDGGFGWGTDHPRMKKFVIEIHNYSPVR